MKKTITFYDFEDAFYNHGRGNQFSYEALQALFDYYEDLEESTGVEIELDVIAICCDWTEYSDIEEIENDYEKGFTSIADIWEYTEAVETEAGTILLLDF